MTFDFKPGDVVRYTPEPGHNTDGRHCREGMAVAEERESGTPLFDTFWSSSGDRHLLTYDEMQSGEVIFNLEEFELITLNVRYQWEDYHPDDRRAVTHQHGLQRDLYVRNGAKPDHGTKIENAKGKVADAESELKNAEWRLNHAREELARLEAAAVTA